MNAITGLNRFEFICRVMAAPEVRYGQTGTPFCDLEVGIMKFVRGGAQKEVSVNVKIYGEQAEEIRETCIAGSRLFIEGEISVDEWKDKQTQQPRSKMVLSGSRVMFLDRRGEAPASAPPPAQSKPRTPWSNPSAPPAQQDLPPAKKEKDDVPF